MAKLLTILQISKVKKLSLRQILILHELMVKNHGGSSGIRDMNMLESAVNRPFATFAGADLYQDIFMKAGALIQSIVKNHPFLDGNKRTAWASADSFLKLNNIKIVVSRKVVVKFMASVANKNLSVDEISSWLKLHSRKI